jgi:hypothetical protein
MAGPPRRAGPDRSLAHGIRIAAVRLSLCGERIADHADLTPPTHHMASVRRIPALSTVASAFAPVAAVRKQWQCPGIANPRAVCRVPPIKEDGCRETSPRAAGRSLSAVAT